MFTHISQYSMAEIAGVGGFLLYVFNSSMLSLRRVSSECIGYYAVNICAASLVLIGLTTSFNLAAALIQSFFIAMSSIGIALRLYRARHRYGPAPATPADAAPLRTPPRPAARFRSAPHWADASPGTGSPDRVCG